jgi:ribonuclease HII
MRHHVQLAQAGDELLGVIRPVRADGLPLRNFAYPHDAIVNGDARSLCVAMASIAATVFRDRIMSELEAAHPGYGFASHKGYSTDEHREAVLRLGKCVHHREMFLRKLYAGRLDPAQMELLD